MTIREILKDVRAFAAPDETGGAPQDGTETQDDAASDVPGQPSDTEPAATEQGSDNTSAGTTDPDWWKSPTYTDAQRDLLTKKGLTKGTPDEVVPKLLDMYAGSQKLLGGDHEKLISKPEDPAKVSEWMRANAEAFGLPDDVDGYALENLDLPEGVERDSDLEGQVKQIAFEEGVPPAALKRFAEAYATRIGGQVAQMESDLKAATARMETELKSEWGDQYGARTLQAQQAFSAISQQAGLDQDTQTAMFATLKETGGDAAVMKLFATVGGMMGEDTLERGQGVKLGTTPAEARQQAAAMRAKDGPYGKAYAAGDRAEMQRLQPQLAQLDRIASGG